MGLLRETIEIKSTDQLKLMRKAGLVVADALAAVRDAVKVGITTGELDAIAEDVIRSAGAVPSFLDYPYSGDNDFPASICASVNDEIVHGIPGPRKLAEGDLISIDCGAILDGWHGDAAITVPVGDIPKEWTALVDATDAGLWAGLAAGRVGGRLGDVSAAVEQAIRAHQPADAPYGIVINCVGHGIGSQMHMAPQVPNVGRPGRGPKLVEGLAIAVEPMITLGPPDNSTLADGWTITTDDGSPAAHIEHTVCYTKGGPWVLTAHDGGEQRLSGLGVRCGALAD